MCTDYHINCHQKGWNIDFKYYNQFFNLMYTKPQRRCLVGNDFKTATHAHTLTHNCSSFSSIQLD